jgi:hypothetical protein
LLGQAWDGLVFRRRERAQTEYLCHPRTADLRARPVALLPHRFRWAPCPDTQRDAFQVGKNSVMRRVEERSLGGNLFALVMSGLTVCGPEGFTERTQQRVLRTLLWESRSPPCPLPLQAFGASPFGCPVEGAACFLRPRAYGGPRRSAQTASGPLPAPRPTAGFPRRDCIEQTIDFWPETVD